MLEAAHAALGEARAEAESAARDALVARLRVAGLEAAWTGDRADMPPPPDTRLVAPEWGCGHARWWAPFVVQALRGLVWCVSMAYFQGSSRAPLNCTSFPTCARSIASNLPSTVEAAATERSEARALADVERENERLKKEVQPMWERFGGGGGFEYYCNRVRLVNGQR